MDSLQASSGRIRWDVMPPSEGLSDTYLFYNQDPGHSTVVQILTLIPECGKYS